VDTASSFSIPQPLVSNSEVRITSMNPYGVTGEALDIKGRQSVTFELDGRDYIHTFWYAPSPQTQPVCWAQTF
jgi:hypothetical protein